MRLVILALTIEARAQIDRPLRSAFGFAALREDLNDPVRRFRAVERCRRRAFQDFDVIDVIGIQVGEAVFTSAAVEVAARLVAEIRRPVSGARVSANAIDVHHGALVEREARRAADPQVLGATNAAADARRAHAGDLAFENGAQVRGRLHVLDLARIDDTDWSAQFALGDGAAGAGRDDFAQRDGALLHREVYVHRVARVHGDRSRVGPIAEALRADGRRPALHAANDEPPASIRLRPKLRAADRDRSATQRLAGCPVSDNTDDNASLLCPEEDGCGGEGECDRPTRSTQRTWRGQLRGIGFHETL